MRVALSFFLLGIGLLVSSVNPSRLDEALQNSATSTEELMRLLDDQAKQLFDKDLGEGSLAEKLVRFYSFEPEDVTQSPAASTSEAVNQAEAYINANLEEGFKDLKKFMVPVRKTIAGGFFAETKSKNLNRAESDVEINEVNADVALQKIDQKLNKVQGMTQLVKEDLSAFIRDNKPIYRDTCNIWGGFSEHYIFNHELLEILHEKLSYLYWAVADGKFPDMDAAVDRAVNIVEFLPAGKSKKDGFDTLIEAYTDDLVDDSVTKKGTAFIKKFVSAYWKLILTYYPDSAKPIIQHNVTFIISAYIAAANKKFNKGGKTRSYKISVNLIKFLAKKWVDEHWSVGTKGKNAEEEQMATIFKFDFLVNALKYRPDLYNQQLLADLQENADVLILEDLMVFFRASNSLVVLDIDVDLEGNMYDFKNNIYNTYLHFQIGNSRFENVADEFDNYLDSHNQEVIANSKFPVDSKWYLATKFANSIHLSKDQLAFKPIRPEHVQQVDLLYKTHGSQRMVDFIGKVGRIHLNVPNRATPVEWTLLESRPIPRSLIQENLYTKANIVL